MFDWFKRLFFGDSNHETDSKSDVDSIQKEPIKSEPEKSSSDSKTSKKKHAREHSRRQRARENQLARDLHKNDSKMIARGGFSFGGGGA